MNTQSHKSGNTSLAFKMVIFICDDRSELYEGNTFNVAKRLNFKGCRCVIRFH